MSRISTSSISKKVFHPTVALGPIFPFVPELALTLQKEKRLKERVVTS
jgi:hypothetical protein